MRIYKPPQAVSQILSPSPKQTHSLQSSITSYTLFINQSLLSKAIIMRFTAIIAAAIISYSTAVLGDISATDAKDPANVLKHDIGRLNHDAQRVEHAFRPGNVPNLPGAPGRHHRIVTRDVEAVEDGEVDAVSEDLDAVSLARKRGKGRRRSKGKGKGKGKGRVRTVEARAVEELTAVEDGEVDAVSEDLDAVSLARKRGKGRRRSKGKGKGKGKGRVRTVEARAVEEFTAAEDGEVDAVSDDLEAVSLARKKGKGRRRFGGKGKAHRRVIITRATPEAERQRERERLQHDQKDAAKIEHQLAQHPNAPNFQPPRGNAPHPNGAPFNGNAPHPNGPPRGGPAGVPHGPAPGRPF
ncbi:hypothetical protein BT63DRAFT_44069 [Microthyrium microscopicum]|uniref:Uncharacterized protein n=1 Tax=Microthyrium microscopicum TaxID=703497 RepID=A0A6A6U0U4_9PEZI|nr:hypothetical protein BT63DRAFT_44069 [Microthyrium microscopicum]